MKKIKVGVLCRYREDFIDFCISNPIFQAHHIYNEESLIGTDTFDFYVRLYNWRTLPKNLLKAIEVTEVFRGLKPEQNKPLTNTYHPNCRSVMRKDMEDAFSYASVVIQQAGIKFENETKSLIFPDEQIP